MDVDGCLVLKLLSAVLADDLVPHAVETSHMFLQGARLTKAPPANLTHQTVRPVAVCLVAPEVAGFDVAGIALPAYELEQGCDSGRVPGRKMGPATRHHLGRRNGEGRLVWGVSELAVILPDCRFAGLVGRGRTTNREAAQCCK